MAEEFFPVLGTILQRFENFPAVPGVMQSGANHFQHFASGRQIFPGREARFDCLREGAVTAAAPFLTADSAVDDMFDEPGFSPGFNQPVMIGVPCLAFSQLLQTLYRIAEINLTSSPVADGFRDIDFENHLRLPFVKTHQEAETGERRPDNFFDLPIRIRRQQTVLQAIHRGYPTSVDRLFKPLLMHYASNIAQLYEKSSPFSKKVAFFIPPPYGVSRIGVVKLIYDPAKPQRGDGI